MVFCYNKKMDREKIIKLENYIFEHHTRADMAASAMACYMGVIIGVKPAAVSDFEFEEFIKIDPAEIIDLLDQVGLRSLFFTHEYIKIDKPTRIEEAYISRDFKTGAELHSLFQKLRSSIDNLGQVFNEKLWEESSRGIGRLLGYPDTAIEYFIANQDVDDTERQSLMDRYRFYVHSPEHHEQEYQAYDRKIYQALHDYAPKTSEILSANRNKRWL